MNSAKRSSKRKLQISSDSDEDIKTTETDINTRRQSSRIYDKQRRPEFRLPSRDKVWNDIPSMKSVSKLKSITPRKSVNNFTKVYNTYNYDDYEDTSDDESSAVETSDSDDQKKRQHRIKNFHKRKRLQVQSSSSDEDGDHLDKNVKASIPISAKEQDKKDTPETTDEVGSEHSCHDTKSKFEPGKGIDCENADLGDSDESEMLSPGKRSMRARNRSLLESDDESSEKDNDNNSDSKNNDISQSSDSSDHPVESSKYRFANQKIKQINLFQKFRDAQAKRKKNIPST